MLQEPTQPCKGPYLPTYEESMKISQYSDPMRLPNYQSRSLLRYHPYIRYTRDKESICEKYMNTIYDDERIALEIPLSLHRQDASSASESETNTRLSEPPVVPQNDGLDDRQTELERRIQRLSSVMVEFLAAIKRANERYEAECLSAYENGATSAEREDLHGEPSFGDL